MNSDFYKSFKEKKQQQEQQAKAEAEAKAKAQQEADAKAKAQAEAQAKLDAENKAKQAEADAKVQAEKDAQIVNLKTQLANQKPSCDCDAKFKQLNDQLQEVLGSLLDDHSKLKAQVDVLVSSKSNDQVPKQPLQLRKSN